MKVQRGTTAALLGAALLLTACAAMGGPRAERGPVSLAGWEAVLTDATSIDLSVPSCNGDPVVDELAETDQEVRVKVVTTVVVSGASDDGLDGVRVNLQDPLGERPLIDAESGETIPVTQLETPARSDRMQTEPSVAPPGGTIDVTFPKRDTRGPGFVIDQQSPDGWDFEWAVSSDPDAPDMVNIWTAEEFGDQGVEWGGPAFDSDQPHIIPIPDDTEAGHFRVRTAASAVTLCAGFQVAEDP